MAIFSTLRSRRFAAVQTETTEQIITFCLREEWFALPILAVQKVIPLGKVYGDPQGTGVSITAYEEQEIIVIDVAKFIFQDSSSSNRKSSDFGLRTSGRQEFERDTSLLLNKFDSEPEQSDFDLVFSEMNTVTSELSWLDWEQQRYLVIINLYKENQDLLGLPIDSQPIMRRVTKSNFKALPQAYLDRGNINCVSEEIIELPEHPPIFLLNPQSLARAYNLNLEEKH